MEWLKGPWLVGQTGTKVSVVCRRAKSTSKAHDEVLDLASLCYNAECTIQSYTPNSLVWMKCRQFASISINKIQALEAQIYEISAILAVLRYIQQRQKLKLIHEAQSLLSEFRIKAHSSLSWRLSTRGTALKVSTSGLLDSTFVRSPHPTNIRELTYLNDYGLHARSFETNTGDMTARTSSGYCNSQEWEK